MPRAVTLQQPWATLIAIGAKRIETRCWRTTYRGPLVITASAIQGAEGRRLTVQPVCYEAMRTHGASRLWNGITPYGSAIATCNLIDCLPMEAHICLPGVFDDYPELGTPQERAFGNFDVFDKGNGRRRWAFVLDAVKPLREPIAVRGALGLWRWEQSARSRIYELAANEQPQ